MKRCKKCGCWAQDGALDADQTCDSCAGRTFVTQPASGEVFNQPERSEPSMLLLSIEEIPEGMAALGLVRGSTVRSKDALKDIGAGLKSIVGGELVSYTRLMAEAREQAIQRMKDDALLLGATAIVGIRFASATIGAGAAEIMVWGTAVILDEQHHGE